MYHHVQTHSFGLSVLTPLHCGLLHYSKSWQIVYTILSRPPRIAGTYSAHSSETSVCSWNFYCALVWGVAIAVFFCCDITDTLKYALFIPNCFSQIARILAWTLLIYLLGIDHDQ